MANQELELKETLLKEKQLTRPLAESVQALAKFGGFDFIKTIIDGTENMEIGRAHV